MSTVTQLPGVIRDKLLAMDRQRRELSAVSGVGEWLCLGVVAVGICLMADSFGNLSPAWRSGLLAGLAITLLAGLWFLVVRPLLSRRSWAELAAAVEHDHPELKERLTTLVELRSETEFGRASSPLMQELLARQTVKAVSQVEFTDTLPAGRSLQRGALGLAALAVLLLPFLMPGSRYALSWQRLLVPWANHDWGSRLAFLIPDGDRVVAKGTDVALRAELDGGQPTADSPLAVTLRWVDDQGRSHQRPMTWNADEEIYAVTLPRVEHSFRYKVTCRAAVSREYRITAADRPRITTWHMELQPPGYTGLPARALDAAVSELTVPEHSRVAFRWQFAEPVVAAEISWPETFVEHAPLKSDDASPQTKIRSTEMPLILSPDRRSGTMDLTATAGGSFEVRLTSDLGLESDEPSHTLTVIVDQPPEIAVVNPRAVTSIQPEDVLPIEMTAGDDYGLSAVELHWETSTGQQGNRAIPAEELTGRDLEYRWEVDVGQWKLANGQAVTYRLRAVDNRPIPSPQETWTEPITVAVSSRAELVESRELASAQESLEKELDAFKEALSDQKKAVDEEHRETAREAVRGDQRPENQDELNKLTEQQETLRERLEALRDELQQRPMLEQAAKERLPQIEEKLAQAERSLEEAAQAKEARDQIEKLSKSLDDLGEAENQLEQLKQESKALAALEQELAELGRLSRKADQLADQAESFERRAEESKGQAKPQADSEPAVNSRNAPRQDPAPPSEASPAESAPTAEELDQLRKETEQLTERLDDLLRRRPELLEAARKLELERLERLAEMAERLAQPQERLAEALTREAQNDALSAPDDTASPDDRPAADTPQNGDPSEQKPQAEPPVASAESMAAGKPPASQPEKGAASQPSASEANGEKSEKPSDEPSPNQSETPRADSPKSEPSPSQAERNSNAENAESLSQEISRAVQQQQRLAHEASALQRAAQVDSETPPSEPQIRPGADAGEAKPSEQNPGDQPDADDQQPPARSSEEALTDFADQAKSAAAAAQAGDLQQAAEQSRQASDSARQAAKPGMSEEGTPESPDAAKAGQLAERQQELADEFERLAQSSEARQQAQRQSQEQLQQAAESLASALEQSAEQLSQQPVDLPKSGRSASEAGQSAKSAGESMKAAAESLEQGDPQTASQQAQAARNQLQQAAQQAREAQGDQPASSPQGENVPGKTASQVVRAANQLKQAQERLAQAQSESSSPGNKSEMPPSGEKPSGEKSSGEKSSGEKSSGEKSSGEKSSGEKSSGEKSSGDGSSGEKSFGEESSGEGSNSEGTPPAETGDRPGNSSPMNAGQPGQPPEGQPAGQPSELAQSAEQLRQAAKSLAAASQGNRPSNGRKRGSQGKPGLQGPPESPLAGPPSEPGDAANTPEGFSPLGQGASEATEELGSLGELAKPSAGMRNWGRLPKNLQTEILQGSTKKSHPEYSRQIKSYFEQIARPAGKQDRP